MDSVVVLLREDAPGHARCLGELTITTRGKISAWRVPMEDWPPVEILRELLAALADPRVQSWWAGEFPRRWGLWRR